VLGVGGYFRRFTKPFEMALPIRILFIPLTSSGDVKPVTLSLRLFAHLCRNAGCVPAWAADTLYVGPGAGREWPGSAFGVGYPDRRGITDPVEGVRHLFVGSIQDLSSPC